MLLVASIVQAVSASAGGLEGMESWLMRLSMTIDEAAMGTVRGRERGFPLYCAWERSKREEESESR